jgi:hypothetical protein
MKALGRLAVWWVALMSGLLSLGRELFLAYRAAIGQPVAPTQTLALFGRLSLAAFILCAAAAWWFEHAEVVRLRAELTDKTIPVDMRIRDKALLLHRSLLATFEDCAYPQAVDELRNWGRAFAHGVEATGPAFVELVDLRPEASEKIRDAVGVARTEFYAAADFINPLAKNSWWIVPGATPPASAGRALLQAVVHVRQCLRALDGIIGI